ncbi:iron ABC transporter permease [Candidatus Pelagibacter ubique]|jgi:iron(III) transport system permease protein|nr:iron ABC transporter permease [Candidatus Pelagibacter bacterium]MDA7444001.1 iron ABC transporter permease [Candidatus Pelagibacter ubique]MDA7444324.1 iron ABC transporter permease [Candidatus Pelagibacter ubique]MDA7456162.1 iron ABC transporter permease [Candidatus Pelagibacter ubique]MDA7479105.1 iron ABC transporter permease [Candidatus Pelagibacter ubique]MDA7481821.1 iron ABC transporter permease [Candidatus Pelagibacter ubique]
MSNRINIWYLSSFLISIFVAIPIITVFSSFFQTTGDYVSVLKNTFLLDYIYNSLILLIGVLTLTFIIGVGCAYLVSFYKFPGVNFFKWALILSFAVPAYIYAYSLTAFFENYGTAFSILKNLLGEGNYNAHIPKFDGMLGAIISISFSLFGYVYVLTRASFHYQSQNLLELGKNLGFSKQKSFFKIILPSARPAIVAGLSLVAMEALSDFGSVSFFGVSTLTTGIYNAWISFDDLTLANRLSSYLLIFILGLFVLENLSRKKAQYHTSSKGGFKSKSVIQLSGYKSITASLFCIAVFFLSFLFPVFQMLYWTIIFPKHLLDLNLIQLFSNTILLVFLACCVLILLAFISNYGSRVSKSKFLDTLNTFSISGYAIPGIILAVAFITFISWLDLNMINYLGTESIKSIFIGSILGLVIIYFIRFYSLANNGIKSGYLKINYSIDESAYLLGYSKFKTFRNIHLPYLKNSVLLIGILLTIEIIKELPITLIMRPFNFETFATKAYIYASQDLLEAAAAPSLLLILIASCFILITSRYILKD